MSTGHEKSKPNLQRKRGSKPSVEKIIGRRRIIGAGEELEKEGAHWPLQREALGSDLASVCDINFLRVLLSPTPTSISLHSMKSLLGKHFPVKPTNQLMIDRWVRVGTLETTLLKKKIANYKRHLNWKICLLFIILQKLRIETKEMKKKKLTNKNQIFIQHSKTFLS